jgi:hypothetical protein
MKTFNVENDIIFIIIRILQLIFIIGLPIYIFYRISKIFKKTKKIDF